MKEFIRFKNKVSVRDIQKILEILEIRYSFNYLNDNFYLEGVSNGLSKINGTVCFIENIKSTTELESIKDSLIFTNSRSIQECDDFNIIEFEDCRYAFIKMLEYFSQEMFLENFTTEIGYKDSCVSYKANIHENAIVEDYVVIGDNVVISAGCVIKNGTYIGQGTIIRENCTVGCDGIALYKAKNGEVLRFPHVAGVYIGANVEIGANSVIVKGTLSNTVIGEDTVIGNLCNIGHGVKIGKKLWLSVGGMIGGNCTIEDNVTIGLGVSLKDNLFIAQDSTIGMGSVVTKSLLHKCTVFGNPAKPLRPLSVGPNR